VHNTRFSVQQEHARTQAVERIGESRRFCLLEIDNSRDQHRTADVRNNEANAPTRFIVDQAVAFVTKNAKHRYSGH